MHVNGETNVNTEQWTINKNVALHTYISLIIIDKVVSWLELDGYAVISICVEMITFYT